MKAALFLLPVITATAAFALKQEPTSGKLVLPKFEQSSACGDRPEFLTESRTEIVGTIDKLPQMGVLVARDAEYYVEGQTETGSPIRVHGYQSFVRTQSNTKILCGQNSKGVKERFSVFAPTLIDTTLAHKTGNSIWQFQIVANEDQFSAWNIKSPVSNDSEKLGKVLGKMGSKYKIYQTGHNEYELMVIQENKGITEYLSIRYDAVRAVK